MPERSSEAKPAGIEEIVKRLLRLILNAHQEIEILHRIVAHGVSLPLSKFEEVRRDVVQDFVPLMRTVEDAPHDKLLEFLRHYEGTVQ